MPITELLEMTIENAYEYAYSPEMLDTHKPMEFRVKGGRRWYSEIKIDTWAVKHFYRLVWDNPKSRYRQTVRVISYDTIVQIRMKKADSHER